MTTHNPQESMDTIYEYLWSTGRRDLFSRLDQSFRPRASSMLFDIAARLGITANSTVLDVGCGRGNYACELAIRLGCNVVGLDPVSSNLDIARTIANKEALHKLVTFQQGNIEELPFENASFDFIWCRDMLVHVEKSQQGIAECARVLKHGGSMIVHTTYATDLMEAGEAKRLYSSLGIVPSNMSSSFMEDLFVTCGFQIASSESIGGEWVEYIEEHEGRSIKSLLRIARMVRARERLIVELGETAYTVALAVYTWHIYQLIGKLSSAVYILKKPLV